MRDWRKVNFKQEPVNGTFENGNKIYKTEGPTGLSNKKKNQKTKTLNEKPSSRNTGKRQN